MVKNSIMGLFVMALGILVVFALTATSNVNAVECQTAISAVATCRDFLVGAGPAQPSAECCMGVQALVKMGNSTEARRELCQCFKDAAPSLGIKYDRAKLLPSLCHVKIGFKIRPDIDCKS